MRARISRYYNIITQQKHPVRFLLGSLIMYSGASRCLKIQRNGYRLYFHPSAVSRYLWMQKNALVKDEKLLSDCLQKGGVFIDIGANIGHLSCKAAPLVGNEGQVIAVEPNTKTYMHLKQNVQLNKFHWVKTLCCAAAEAPQIVEFNCEGSDDIHHIGKSSHGGQLVPSLKLDYLEPYLKKKDISEVFLKIDVEGYEYFAFQGATELLKKVGAVYFENNTAFCQRYGYAPKDVISLLRDQSFDVFFIEGEILTPVADKALPAKGNLLAIKDSDAFCQRTGYRIKS